MANPRIETRLGNMVSRLYAANLAYNNLAKSNPGEISDPQEITIVIKEYFKAIKSANKILEKAKDQDLTESAKGHLNQINRLIEDLPALPNGKKLSEATQAEVIEHLMKVLNLTAVEATKSTPAPPTRSNPLESKISTSTTKVDDNPFAGITLHEFDQPPLKPRKKKEVDIFAEEKKRLDESHAKIAAADAAAKEEAKTVQELSKETDPRKRLLYDLQWLCQQLVEKAPAAPQFHEDLAKVLPHIRLGILTAVHLHPDKFTEFKKVVKNLKSRMRAAGIISKQESDIQNVPTQKLTTDRQIDQINNNLLIVMGKRKLKTASDLAEDQSMLSTITYSDNITLWRQLLKDPTFNLEGTSGINKKTILHLLLADTAKARPEKALEIIKILLQNPQIVKIINELDSSNHTPLDYAPCLTNAST